jgi:nucleoside-diphosphate-sugar epimerase
MNLVTGATGLVGTRITYDLLKSGEDVRGLKRANSDLDFMKSVFEFYDPTDGARLFEKILWMEAELLDLEALSSALEKVKTVYHCAALVSYDPRDKQKLLDSNYEGTRNVINLCLSSKVEALCHVSSVAALGRAPKGQKTSEETLWTKEQNRSVYGLSKHLAEMEVWRGISEGLDAVIINPSVILAPSKPDQSSGMLMALLKKGSTLYPAGTTGYVDVRDVSAIAISLMKNKNYGERFLCNSENVPFKELLQMASRILGGKSPKYPLNANLLKIAGWLNQLISSLTGVRPKITPETARSATKQNFYDNSKVHERLGISFTSVEDSLKYYREFAP